MANNLSLFGITFAIPGTNLAIQIGGINLRDGTIVPFVAPSIGLGAGRFTFDSMQFEPWVELDNILGEGIVTQVVLGPGFGEVFSGDGEKLGTYFGLGFGIGASAGYTVLIGESAVAALLAAVAIGLLTPVVGPIWAGTLLGIAAGTALSHALFRERKDPLVLDLDGDGIELTTLADSDTHFDFDRDGFAERTGWVSGDDGILAFDGNNNGVIDSISEMFGSSRQDGFAVLEALDSNHDGVIDAGDADFAKLRVWRDLNQNGVSDAGELQTLAEAGIASLSLSRTKASGTNAGNDRGYTGSFTRADGTTRAMESIYFATDRQDTATDQTPELTRAEGVDKLPQLAGSDMIHSIAYKASNDNVLRVTA